MWQTALSVHVATSRIGGFPPRAVQIPRLPGSRESYFLVKKNVSSVPKQDFSGCLHQPAGSYEGMHPLHHVCNLGVYMVC